MKNYKYILFDLDGTITDSALGITNSVKYALNKLNAPIPPYETLCKFIGPPLLDGFRDFCGFDNEKAHTAVNLYREYYKTTGIFENAVYDGIPELLKAVQDGLYNKALERRAQMTYDAHNMDEMIDIADNKPGFIRAMWCGDRECEDKLKEMAGVTSRCIPFEEEHLSDTCVCCGKPAKHMLYWGKAY